MPDQTPDFGPDDLREKIRRLPDDDLREKCLKANVDFLSSGDRIDRARASVVMIVLQSEMEARGIELTEDQVEVLGNAARENAANFLRSIALDDLNIGDADLASTAWDAADEVDALLDSPSTEEQ